MKVKRTGAADYGRYIKALICGESKVGKTLTSSTWPNPLILSAENRLMAVAARNIPYVDITSSKDFLEVKLNLNQPAEVREKLFGFPVETVIVDTIDEIQKILVRERLKETGKEVFKGFDDWGWLNGQMDAIISGFRNLDMHVVFVCHTKSEVDEESGRVSYKPALQGASSNTLGQYFDLTVLMRAVEKTEAVGKEVQKVTYRYFQTYPDAGHPWIGDSSHTLPREFPINFDDDYARLYETIYANVVIPEGEEIEIDGVEIKDGFVESPEAIEVAPEPQPKAEKSAGADGCADCGETDISSDQRTLSRIKYRKILCRDCFTKVKDSDKQKVGV